MEMVWNLKMDFSESKLKKWVPKKISIQYEDYMNKFKCTKCENHVQNLKQMGVYNPRGQKIHDDLFFDIYYWILPDPLVQETKDIYQKNYFGYIEEIENLKNIFELYDCIYDPIPELTRKAYEIGMFKLIDLCTYHSLWLHYFYHQMSKLEYSCFMYDWDDMHQSDHVKSKNSLNFLIYLLLTDEKRKNLMQEIQEFSICPPIKLNGVSGYEYKMANERFNCFASSR